jgi:hypothetical protein
MTTTNHKMTSLFVPRIFKSVDEARIRKVVEQDHKLGVVESIDLVPKSAEDGKTYNSAYIHMSSWNHDDKTEKFLSDLQDPNTQTQLIYDKPWFWIVLLNTSVKKPKFVKKQTVGPPNSPDQGFAKAKPPGAPIKASKKPRSILTDAVSIRNLEQIFVEQDDESMNLVDADYVYHTEQDNTSLRNNNAWLLQQNFNMQKEIDRLRTMMHSLVAGRM